MVKLGLVPDIVPMHACGYHPCGDWVKLGLLKLHLFNRAEVPVMVRALADGEDNDDPEWTILDCGNLIPNVA